MTMIKKYNYGNETFSLQPISEEEILKAVKKLPSNKGRITKPPTTDRPPTIEHRPTDRSSTDLLTTDPSTHQPY